MEHAQPSHDSPLGRVSISNDAVAQIVAQTAAECYGVVGMSAPDRLRGLLAREGKPTRGIVVQREGEGLSIDLYVVVEYGLNLAEVAATVRSQVGYELERLTGLPIASIDVHIKDVRRSA